MSLTLTACSDEAYTKKLLESQGYTSIETYGHSWWSCSDDDTYATKFTAKNPNGFDVKGTVCSNLIVKDATIRFE